MCSPHGGRLRLAKRVGQYGAALGIGRCKPHRRSSAEQRRKRWSKLPTCGSTSMSPCRSMPHVRSGRHRRNALQSLLRHSKRRPASTAVKKLASAQDANLAVISKPVAGGLVLCGWDKLLQSPPRHHRQHRAARGRTLDLLVNRLCDAGEPVTVGWTRYDIGELAFDPMHRGGFAADLIAQAGA